jgi:hypothetical protein
MTGIGPIRMIPKPLTSPPRLPRRTVKTINPDATIAIPKRVRKEGLIPLITESEEEQKEEEK